MICLHLESFVHSDTQHKREVCPIECTEISFDYKLTEARYVPHNRGSGRSGDTMASQRRHAYSISIIHQHRKKESLLFFDTGC